MPQTLFDRDVFRPMFSSLLDLPRLGTSTEPVGLMPAVEISESDGEFVCTAELPGLNDKDVEVTFADGELRIKGEKKEEKETKGDGKRYHIWERSYGAFERTFTFPSDVEASKVSAEFKNGVLTVRLPKSANGKRASRTIPVVTK
jgi:HSP20 family protein